MSCKDYLLLVEKLADGEVTPAEKREVEAHLEACEDCREHFRFLETLPTVARQPSPGEPPEIYWDALPRKVMARIAQLGPGERRPQRRWLFGLLSPSGLRWVGALAAAVVAAVVGWRVLETPFTDQRTSGDAVRPTVAENVAGGKADQRVVGDRLVLGERPADETSSAPSFSAPEEGEPHGRDRGAAPSEPASQVATAPSATTPQPPPGTEGKDSLRRTERFADDANEALQKSRAAGETELVTRDESGVEGAQGAGRLEPGARPQVANDQPSAQPTPAPVGVRALQSRPEQEAAQSTAEANAPTVSMLSAEEDYRALLERYPLGSAVSADVVGETTTSSEGAASDKVKECADWRRFVDEHGGSEQGVSARYRLAICSIALYDLEPSDPSRRRALTDGRSFLAVEPSGDRAVTIRRALDRMER